MIFFAYSSLTVGSVFNSSRLALFRSTFFAGFAGVCFVDVVPLGVAGFAAGWVDGAGAALLLVGGELALLDVGSAASAPAGTRATRHVKTTDLQLTSSPDFTGLPFGRAPECSRKSPQLYLTYLDKRKPGSVATAGPFVIATGETPAAFVTTASVSPYRACTSLMPAVRPDAWQMKHCSTRVVGTVLRAS